MSLTGLKSLAQARAEVIEPLNGDLFNALAPWMDKEGYIGNKVQPNAESPEGIDYGDSMQRTGFTAIGELLDEDRERVTVLGLKFYWAQRIDAHRIGKGLYVRRPNTEHWYSKLNTTTGDQLRPIIIAMGIIGMRKELKALAWAMIKRAGFYWNTRDTGATRQGKRKMPGWSGPEHWNLFIRALWPKSWLAKLALLPGDLIGLFATAFSVFSYAKEARNVDQLNRMAALVQGAAFNPTPLSLLSLWIFRKFRPTWDTFVDQNWLRIWKPNKHKNAGLYVLENYFWHRDIDPPLEFGPWRSLCKRYFHK